MRSISEINRDLTSVRLRLADGEDVKNVACSLFAEFLTALNEDHESVHGCFNTQQYHAEHQAYMLIERLYGIVILIKWDRAAQQYVYVLPTVYRRSEAQNATFEQFLSDVEQAYLQMELTT